MKSDAVYALSKAPLEFLTVPALGSHFVRNLGGTIFPQIALAIRVLNSILRISKVIHPSKLPIRGIPIGIPMEKLQKRFSALQMIDEYEKLKISSKVSMR